MYSWSFLYHPSKAIFPLSKPRLKKCEAGKVCEEEFHFNQHLHLVQLKPVSTVQPNCMVLFSRLQQDCFVV